MNHYLSTTWLVFKHEILLVYRNLSEILNPILFFILVCCLFPLGIGPEQNLLTQIAPGVIWIVALLGILLSLDRLFRSDFEDGTIEQLLLSPQPLSLLIFAKIFAHWLMTSLTFILITPLLALFFHLTLHALIILMITLLLGTPTLIFIGAIGRALTLNLRNRSLLLTLLIMPLYVPVLIMGAGSVVLAGQGIAVNGQIAILAAMLCITLPLAPLATAAALKIGAN